MKEDKSAQETSRATESPEIRDPARKPRVARTAPRTEISTSAPQSGDTQQRINALLADEFVLYVQTLNYHWNVRGMQFHSLHAFFEKLYQQQAGTIDDIAEKVRSLGGFAMATLEEYLGNTRLKEKIGEPPPDPRVMISTLAGDYELIIRHIRETIRTLKQKVDDPSTDNFLCGLLEKHEKTLWMLQAHLDRELG
jgi:starvation-inducible DNA-binding protein